MALVKFNTSTQSPQASSNTTKIILGVITLGVLYYFFVYKPKKDAEKLAQKHEG